MLRKLRDKCLENKNFHAVNPNASRTDPEGMENYPRLL